MSVLTDEEVKKTLGLKIGDAPSATDSSLNKEYNAAVKSGKFKGSFSDFMKHLDSSKIDKGVNLLDSVRKLFSKDQPAVDYTAPKNNDDPKPMNPILKWSIIAGATGLTIWGIVAVVKHFNK
jgi:hypothetical protein